MTRHILFLFALLITVLVTVVFSSDASAQDEFAPSGRNLAAPAQLEQWDSFVGKWEVRGMNQPLDTPPRATTHAFYILDGYAMQEDYRSLNASGQVVFRGTSIRTYDPVKSHFAIHWIASGTSDYTIIQAVRTSDEINATGHGEDARGTFVERYRMFEITQDSHLFELDRSYDDGTTWLRWAANRRTRIIE